MLGAGQERETKKHKQQMLPRKRQEGEFIMNSFNSAKFYLKGGNPI